MYEEQLKSIIERIDAPGFRLESGAWDGDWFIQVTSRLRMVEEGRIVEQRGQKWRVAFSAQPEEIVQTAFHAVMAFLEAEVRATLLFDGVAVLAPAGGGTAEKPA